MNAYQQLAAELVQTRRMATASSHLRHSSLEDGSVPEYHSGVLTSVWGTQWDGAGGVVRYNGPVPPRPSAPTVTVVPGALLIEVLGTFYDGPLVGAPSDFKQFEVFVSTSSTPVLDREVYRGAVSSARGGQVRVDLDYGETYYAWVATRSDPGNFSEPSPVAGPFVIPKATSADLDIPDLGGNTIFYGAATPTATKAGDVWTKWVNSPTVPAQYELYRWDGDSWERLQDQGAVAAALAASNAQAAADLKLRLYSQDAAPTGLTATDKALWQDTNDGNKGYIWDGDSWEPRLIGNSAIQPASLVASTVLVTGSVTAALLEAIMVISNVFIAGDAAGEHTRIDSTGVANYATIDDLPVELGRQGRGWSVRDPATGEVVAATTDTGVGSFAALTVQEDDITIGGVTMAERDWERPWGLVGDGIYPATGAQSTNSTTELAFFEMDFIAVPGRAYELRTEALEVAADGGDVGAYVRVRRTTDGSIPSTSSALFREVAYRVRATWPGRPALSFFFDGPALGGTEQEWRLLFSYAAANGGTNARIWRGTDIRFWIKDVGPSRENIGQVITGTGGSGGGGSSSPLVTRDVTYSADWIRTWAQNNSTIVTDNELHQGYGDSFNGNRRASAGFGIGLPVFTGAAIHYIGVYLESYHWWNNNGGTLRLGYHTALSEPATFPGHLSIGAAGYTTRVQGKWLRVDGGPGAIADWRTALTGNTFRGISIGGADNSAIYYGKFRSNALLRVKWTV